MSDEQVYDSSEVPDGSPVDAAVDQALADGSSAVVSSTKGQVHGAGFQANKFYVVRDDTVVRVVVQPRAS
ncbi:hypothetical protein [Haloarchaeobius amylolyticus]|uniref:hypothetical protein n=1 Tax=Haloarchaeobius amylolyticus TaxID=1198296 RepID=UPI0022722267|nr:hypothetical protein [Haloarchaeobius amylolyticus]